MSIMGTNNQEEAYILALLRMPQTLLAQMVYKLKRENKELESTLFYARMAAHQIIEDQREIMIIREEIIQDQRLYILELEAKVNSYKA